MAAQGRRRRRGDVALGAAGLGFGACLALGVESVRGGLHLPGGVLLAGGTLAALAGTYLCLMLMLLVSRVPWLEREVGHDRMVALHRQVAPYSLLLISAHVVLTTMAYARAEQSGFWAQLWTLTLHTRWMLPASAGFVVMIALGVMSARVIRRRMRYETWWVAHLYFYIAVALAFAHQIVLSPLFVEHHMARNFWIGLYVLVAAVIVVSRVLAPLWFSARHRLRVAAIVPESDGVLSVYVSGRGLHRMAARGGQFFQWRFLTREWWWQAHPYSLSAAPNEKWLRITIKDLGDQSASLAHRLEVGTRVVAEGPYGVFTAAARTGNVVTAFAAGVGITPIRAVLEDLPGTAKVTVVYRTRSVTDAPLRAEIEQLAEARGWTVHLLDGPRHEHPLTADTLAALVPTLARSDVYMCGPDSFTTSVHRAVSALGVPRQRIHHEAFSF